MGMKGLMCAAIVGLMVNADDEGLSGTSVPHIPKPCVGHREGD